MARLWSCGFELQSATTGVEIDGQSGTGISIDTTTKRGGTASMRIAISGAAGTSYAFKRFSGLTTEAYARIYLYIATAPSSKTGILELDRTSSQVTVAGIYLNTDRTLQAYYANQTAAPNDRTNVGSPSSALNLNTWYCIELYANTAVDASVVTARLNQTQFASQTGITDMGQEGNIFGRVYWGIDAGGWGDTATADLYFDDIAVNDTTGAAQTSWPGPGTIAHVHPNAAGDNTSVLAGTYADIDEVTPDDATTMVTLTTGSALIDVNCESSSTAGIASTDAITLIQVGIRESAASAASESWNLRIKSASGGTTVNGTTTSHSDTTWRTNGSSVAVYTLTSYTDPTTGVAWTPTGTNSIDNMQIGVNGSDPVPTIQISTLWALVEYLSPGVSPSASISPSSSRSPSSSASASVSPSASLSPSASVSPSASRSPSASASASVSPSASISPSASRSPSASSSPSVSPSSSASPSISPSASTSPSASRSPSSSISASISPSSSTSPSSSISASISPSASTSPSASPSATPSPSPSPQPKVTTLDQPIVVGVQVDTDATPTTINNGAIAVTLDQPGGR